METQYLKIGISLQKGTYTIQGVLGQGGFGITYKALMKETASGKLGAMEIDVPVAIKEFFMKDTCIRNDETSAVSVPSTGSKAMVEQYRRKFVKEANNLAGLSHPSIVKVIDVFQENGTDYYVMEYLEGGSLKDYIKKNGKVDEPTALRFINQIGQALSYMHNKKHMCHYDVKPGNILIDKKGDARLIDFGISKGYDERGLETSSTPVGISKGFAPLEQYQQSVQEFSPQSDIYALGATLYNMLTGKIPPEAPVVFNLGLPAMSDSISATTRNAIGQAMQPRKIDRPQMMDDFLALLDDDETLVDNPLKPEPKPEPKPKPKPKPKPQPKPKPEPKPEPKPQPEPNPKPFVLNKGVLGAAFGVLLVIAFIIYMNMGKGPRQEQESVEEEMVDTVAYIETVNNIFFKSGIGDCSYSGPVDDEGKPNGRGVSTFSDGRRYEGNFEHGVMSGNASFKYGNGDMFEGTFGNNGFKEGKYTIKSDGSYFQGTFKNGKPDKGDWYDKNGKKI